MLAASALIAIILGAGVSFAFFGQDDSDTDEQNDSNDVSIQEDDELTYVTIEDLLSGDGRLPIEADVDTLTNTSAEELAPSPTTEGLEADDVSETQEDAAAATDQEFSETNLEEANDALQTEPMPENLISGGPGDTLIGTDGIDHFDITLGTPEDEPTTIENFFAVDGARDGTNSADTETVLEKLWFRDENGTVLSREALFNESIVVEENEEINGVSLLFEARQTVHITNISLAEFTENSLVIGNYGVHAA